MEDSNSELLWKSVQELGRALQKAYSVTGKETIQKQYLEQVKQYPLYLEWFDRIISRLNREAKPISVLEYGCGPGLLAEKLVAHPKVGSYIAIEPETIFREMTEERIGVINPKAKSVIINGRAEEYIANAPLEFIIATATYHHFSNKPKALRRMYDNLKIGGKLLIGEVFLPEYSFDESYNPKDKTEFIERIIEYTAAQILAMPSPKSADIADQIKTALLDILRVEELKVCKSIILQQLQKAGFEEINSQLMRREDSSIDYRRLGYYFITATKT